MASIHRSVAVVSFVLALFLFSSDSLAQWTPAQMREIESFESEERIVGTHYFYWYQYPDHHFYNDAARTSDALQDHFTHPDRVSFNSTAWHAQEMEDCVSAGIDFILPVYWGAPDHYFRPGIAFSIQGLGPLQWAIEERKRRDRPSPKIGMFYDTSTLLPAIRGESREKYDLREAEGMDIFYRTIRDFFYQIHPRHWAAIDGRPIVVLYGSGFAKAHDQTVFDTVYERFPADFHGARPYIIRDFSWNAETDAVTQWGAALDGPYIHDSVAQIGPGYNDMAVPGRSTPIRDREGGVFYRWSWAQTLNSDARIVLIETWNEMHEGTTICETREYGRQYIELTRMYAERFKRGEGSRENLILRNPDPLPRPPSERGREYQDAESVTILATGNALREEGLWLVHAQPDGPVSLTQVDDASAMLSSESQLTYLYFSIADPFAYDVTRPIEIRYVYWDGGHAHHALQYDSHDVETTLRGAYKTSQPVAIRGSDQWTEVTVRLEDARFVNRQNGGADFRFAIHNGWMAIREIEVIKRR